jgi:hypothetical protein
VNTLFVGDDDIALKLGGDYLRLCHVEFTDEEDSFLETDSGVFRGVEAMRDAIIASVPEFLQFQKQLYKKDIDTLFAIAKHDEDLMEYFFIEWADNPETFGIKTDTGMASTADEIIPMLQGCRKHLGAPTKSASMKEMLTSLQAVASEKVPQELSDARMAICQGCEWYKEKPVTHCSDCKCKLPWKTTFSAAYCRKGKWRAYLDKPSKQ